MSPTDSHFQSDGVDCAAWLYRPAGPGPHPLLVMGHGLSATRDLRLPAYADHFCAAGFGILLFDYRHFGDSGGEPRQLMDIGRQLDDWRRAIVHARQIDWADRRRIGLFGTSFAGGHVVKLAAEDPGVAAIVAQCPFQDGLVTVPKLGPVNAAKAAAHGILDQLGALLGRAPHYVRAIAAPGEFALMATADSKSGWDGMMGPGSTWENRVAARVALRIGFYRPGRQSARVACPALYCICDEDTLVPARTTAKLAARAPRGEIRHYQTGHFQIYVGHWFDQVVADQTEFLTRHLLGGAHTAGH